MTNEYLPICISLKARRCLIVGGGRVALRKIDTLLDYESDITVIAPEVVEKIEYYAKRNFLKLDKREYKSPEVSEYGIVISASDDMAVNEKVYEDCSASGVLVNVVDNPPLCDFIFPSVIRRDCLAVAVSSDAKAPFLSRHIRLILENIFPNNWNKVAKLATGFRKKVRSRWQDNLEKKTASFGKFLDTDWKTILKEKSDEEIKKMLDDMLEV
jgi:siroheme synthase-like protein